MRIVACNWNGSSLSRKLGWLVSVSKKLMQPPPLCRLSRCMTGLVGWIGRHSGSGAGRRGAAAAEASGSDDDASGSDDEGSGDSLKAKHKGAAVRQTLLVLARRAGMCVCMCVCVCGSYRVRHGHRMIM